MSAPDYYWFLGLERKLDLDLEDLERRFYNLSRRLHPDRFARATATEQQAALENTAILNDAYRALRDPVSRAEYFLKAHGLELGEQESRKTPPELLEEVFELNMVLDEFRQGGAAARPQLEQAHRHLAALREEADAQLGRLFNEYDHAPDGKLLAAIRGLLNRRRYIRNLEAQVERELANVGALPD
ncbi:MAG: Fe-S protein assembly co-chaperone HscB [Acidobacteriota bacterium]